MIWNALLLALREIRRNVLRSTLTSLGIIIGVAAVITMVTLGNGATKQVSNQISSLGSNLVQVMPGQRPRGPGGARESAQPFKIADADAISNEINGIEPVAPAVSQASQAIYGNENWSTTVTGTTNAFLDVRDWGLANGRLFNESELRGGKPVCIIGSTIRTKLFGSLDPINTTIRLKKLSCRVIGVLESKGQSNFGSDQDEIVLVPMKTMQRRIAGSNDVGMIYVSVKDGVSTEKVKSDIEALLRERRKIAPGNEDNFNVMDMQEIAKVMSGTMTVLTTLLSAVAAVSLLVGGIGIMNIMLVSVTERTREIGTRLAIGALEREVLMQFLVEAMALSSLGGMIGIVLALASCVFLAKILLVPFVFNPGIVIVAFLFSVCVGIVFGYFPARKAAQLDPIEALRHE